MGSVFLSWSGEPSRTVARFLRDWLGQVINAVDCWMSGEDVGAGTRWSAEILAALEGTTTGVFCVTAVNQRSPWLAFEAGSVSRSVERGLTIPYLLDLDPTEVEGPLSLFQSVTADEPGTRQLVDGINATLDRPLPEARLQQSFDRWWPDLAYLLADLPEQSAEPDRIPGRVQKWPHLRTADSLVSYLPELRPQQRRLVHEILRRDGCSLRQLCLALPIRQSEIFYRCRDLEVHELLQITEGDGTYVTASPSVARLLARDRETIMRAAARPDRRG